MSRKTVKGKKIQIKSDTLLATFWKDKQHFADLFNTCLFGGETVIRPEQLEEQESVSSELLVGERWIESVERIRDVIKMSALGTDFVLLGIENQNRIHYAMPLRTMVYDALGYIKQCKEIGKQHKNDKTLNADEYLGKFTKTDKLLAQYTIVIYYGEQEWDGPRSLKEMLDIPEQVAPFVQDYKMNLLEARKFDYCRFATSDVAGLFQLLHISNDKEKMLHEFTGLEVASEVLLVAGEVCDVKEWVELALESGEEVIYVCKAWEEAKNELRNQGLMEGRREGRREGMTLLLEVMQLLKSGKKTEELREEGYDETVIEKANAALLL